MTFEGRAQARVIGQVLHDMLGVSADDCVLEADGYSNALDTALDTPRGKAQNLKFIIGKVPKGTNAF